MRENIHVSLWRKNLSPSIGLSHAAVVFASYPEEEAFQVGDRSTLVLSVFKISWVAYSGHAGVEGPVRASSGATGPVRASSRVAGLG